MAERNEQSVWSRFRRFLGGSRAETSGEASGNGEVRNGKAAAGKGAEATRSESALPERRPAESAPQEDEGDVFSALELRDRVVVMLLFDQVVRAEQVEAAWRCQKDESVETPDTLWRVVALLPNVDRRAVYAQAARVYAFDPVDFNMYGARALLRKRRGTFTQEQWRRMVDLNVAPVRTDYDEGKDAQRWVFATHDPARPAVQRLLDDLGVASHTLRFAPQEQLEELFDDALPRLARERTRQNVLPYAPEDTTAREETSDFMENFAGGASFAEAALREAAEGPAGAAPAASQSASAATAATHAEAEEALLAPAAFFEKVLAGVMQTDARAAYLFGNAEGALTIHHRRRRGVSHWHTEPRLSAEMMIDFVSGRILSLRPVEAESEGAVEYWMGERRLVLRPAITTAAKLPGELPVQGETEVVAIEVLRR